MITLACRRRPDTPAFQALAEVFGQQPGLPLAEVLPAERVEEVFARHNGLFGQGPQDVFPTATTLWAFAGQCLSDGKSASCAAAVAQVAAYARQGDLPVPCGDTGDYCRARAKLSLPALQELRSDLAERLEQAAPQDWLWQGRHAKLVDGFTFTMLDTPQNQRQFPQNPQQKQGLGFPIARACVVLSLATAALLGMALGPYQGKGTGESALLGQMLEGFQEGDVAVLDRHYGSYAVVGMLRRRGVDVCTRWHQRRKWDLRKARRLGKGDWLVTWQRPKQPPWMSREEYAELPATLTVRVIEFRITQPGRRTRALKIVTTLTDPQACSAQQIAELYGYRWNVELDIRQIKRRLNLDHVECKSPSMVLRRLEVTLLGYNLLRKLLAAAALAHGGLPRQLGFTLACQKVLAGWMLLATGAARDPRGLWQETLAVLAANRVANRPGRIEPRALKRRPHPHALLTIPRGQWHAQWSEKEAACN